MAKSAAERKAEQRARDRDSGMVEVLVKVRADRVDELREAESRLQKQKRSKKVAPGP